MNISQLFARIFSSFRTSNEIEQAKEYGRLHAREIVGAYTGALQEEANRLFLEAAEELGGVPSLPGTVEEPVEDVEYTVEDYKQYTKPQLQKELERLGIDYKARDNRETLIEKLTEAEETVDG